MSFKVLKWILMPILLLSLASCEEYGNDDESDRGNIRAGEALEVSNTVLSKLSLQRSERICTALENHHDNILRNVFNEDFSFSRKRKVYGDTVTRDLSNLGVYIDVPNDYDASPFFKGTSGSIKNFIAEIPTENNLYLASICDYVLNGVGSAPKVQEKVGSRYHVFDIISDDRINVGIYTKNNNGSYYLYRSYEYRFDISTNSRYYGMVTEQSEVYIKDYRASDYSFLYQKLVGTN